MTELLLRVVNMSLSASVVIAAVLLARLILRRAPKKWSYLLWSVVGFRLCCPVSFQAMFSLFRLSPVRPEITTAPAVGNLSASSMGYLPRSVGTMPQGNGMIPAVGETVHSSLSAAAPAASVGPMKIWLWVAVGIWLCGVFVLVVCSIVNYGKMKNTMMDAVLLRDNIFETDRIRSPFILGFLRPNIYIPMGLDPQRLEYALAHEEYHMKRRDHLTKTFAFLLLTLHWFNPLVWVAFVLMGKDMEMSCDEKILGANEDSRKAYSMTLLSFAAPNRFPAATPLCFGETSVKSRIKNALNWKRPRTWVSLIAGMLCVALLAACAVNPAAETPVESPAPAVIESAEPVPTDSVDFRPVEEVNATDRLADVLGQLADENGLKDFSGTITLGNDGVVRDWYDLDSAWGSYAYGIVNNFSYTPIDFEQWPDNARYVSISPDSHQWVLLFREDTDQVMIMGEQNYLYQAVPKTEHYLYLNSYTLARHWFDECEYYTAVHDLAGTIPYSGNDYAEAARIYANLYEGIHMTVAEGSMFKYTYQRTTVAFDGENDAYLRQEGVQSGNLWPFRAETVFIPGNEAAEDQAWAGGNTVWYSDYLEDGGPTFIQNAPYNTMIYWRVGYVVRNADGSWQGVMGGTSW